MSYRFLPYARRALAAGLRQADDGSALPARGSMPVVLSVNNTSNPQVEVATYGPGDVRGIDIRAITRLEPVRGTLNHPPNQMATIEFEPPDFPWLFTPARPNDNDQLTPWLVLVVVEQQPGVEIDVIPGQPLPLLRITAPAVPANELPDLREAWAWAHAQVVDTPGDARTSAEVLAGDAAERLSRLVAPRRLAPDKAYHACLVPSFDQGRRAGLGNPVDASQPLQPAWTADDTQVELPLYFHWSFNTGERGDFESLARDMEPREPPALAGGRPTFVGNMHPAIAVNGQANDAVVALPGALRIPGSENPVLADIADAITEELPALLDAPSLQEQDGTIGVGEPVAPPLYGRWHIKQHVVPQVTPRWFRALNLDPRHRIAAGLGAEVVRRRQDDFMQSAWEQVGDILRINQQLDLARFGGALLTRLYEKHILPLPVTDLIKLSAPIHALVGEGGRSVLNQVERSSLPATLLGENARRYTSPQHVVRRVALLGAAGTADQLHQATLTLDLAAGPGFEADPLGLAYDGIGGSTFHDSLDLSQADVDLSELGLSITLRRSDITRLRNLGQDLARTEVKPLQLRADIGNSGFVDDEHIRRLRSITGDESLNGVIGNFLEASRSHRGTVGFRLDPGSRGPLFRPLDVQSGSRIVERPTGRDAAEAPRAVAQLRFRARSKSLLATELERQNAGRLDRRARGSSLSRIGTRPIGTQPTVRMGASTVLRPLVLNGSLVNRFRNTANQHLRDINASRRPAPPAPQTLGLVDTSRLIAAAAQPMDVVLKRNQARVSAYGNRFRFDEDDSPGQDIITEVDRVLVGPRIPRPLYRDLAEMAPESILPGLGDVEDGSIILLESSPSWIEAFLCGANSEMVRELYWRGFPTDRRATVFNRFWDRLPEQRDIPDIHDWLPAQTLGRNSQDVDKELVLVLRGELIRRYPGAVVYTVPATAERKLAPNLTGAMLPAFSGKLDDATLFCGFDLDMEQALAGHGWFFVLEQQVTEPTFGFDAPRPDDPPAPDSWQNASWTHAGTGPGQVLHVTGAAPLAMVVNNSAQFAGVTFQRPFRAAIHADKLVKEVDGAN